MITNWAFFFSTRVVTVLIPRRTTGALLVGASSFPSALATARALSLSFLARLSSGRYLSNSLNSWVAVCLSKVELNWLTGGGTLSLVWRTAFCLCRRMYLGHLTNLERSLLGWMAWPMPKFRVLFSKRGLTTLFTSGFLTARGAAATFFPFFLAFF